MNATSAKGFRVKRMFPVFEFLFSVSGPDGEHMVDTLPALSDLLSKLRVKYPENSFRVRAVRAANQNETKLSVCPNI